MRSLISREFLTRRKSSAAKSRGCSLRVAVFPPISPKADMIGSLQINLGLHRSYILNGRWINVFFIRKASEYFKDLVSWKCELLLERSSTTQYLWWNWTWYNCWTIQVRNFLFFILLKNFSLKVLSFEHKTGI